MKKIKLSIEIHYKSSQRQLIMIDYQIQNDQLQIRWLYRDRTFSSFLCCQKVNQKKLSRLIRYPLIYLGPPYPWSIPFVKADSYLWFIYSNFQNPPLLNLRLCWRNVIVNLYFLELIFYFSCFQEKVLQSKPTLYSYF